MISIWALGWGSNATPAMHPSASNPSFVASRTDWTVTRSKDLTTSRLAPSARDASLLAHLPAAGGAMALLYAAASKIAIPGGNGIPGGSERWSASAAVCGASSANAADASTGADASPSTRWPPNTTSRQAMHACMSRWPSTAVGAKTPSRRSCVS